MKYGYARVSTDDQNPAMQISALQKAGCKKPVFKDDGISGAMTKRPALQRCLKKLKPGDTLIVWKLDRLGRSLRDLITMLSVLRSGRDGQPQDLRPARRQARFRAWPRASRDNIR